MRFRTELDIPRPRIPLSINDKFISMGSCFSQAIGSRLAQGGINIDVIPLGILFNPMSIGNTILRMLDHKTFEVSDLYFEDSTQTHHVLAFDSRWQSLDRHELLTELNRTFVDKSRNVSNADCWLITFGTAWCFRHEPTDVIVGNCHKLPDAQFKRHLCSVDDIVCLWSNVLERAPKVIFTVSPVRHLNDGLHGNTLSKSRLHLAVERLCASFDNAEYFPAYEALVDDLRDYRFYSDDLKHPSTMAEEYIFDIFKSCYFSKADIAKIDEHRRRYRHLLHRPIIK